MLSRQGTDSRLLLSADRSQNEGPREALSNFYSLRGELPAEVAQEVFPKKLTELSELLSDGDFKRERKAVMRLLKDARITPEQREEISSSILQGQLKLAEVDAGERNGLNTQRELQPPKSAVAARDVEKLRVSHLTINRHRLRKPNFLEVVSQPAAIAHTSMKSALEQHVAMLRTASSPHLDMKRIQSDAAFSREHLLIAQRHEFKQRAPSMMTDSTHPAAAKAEQARRSNADKMKRLEKDKAEVHLLRAEAMRQKELLRTTTEKKVDIKKKLNDFRKKLKTYLKERKHPLIGTIMRCVDESLVYHFMEQYEGYTMSVEAILALIGNALGTSFIYPDFSYGEDPEAVEAEQLLDHVVANEKAFQDAIKLQNMMTRYEYEQHQLLLNGNGGGGGEDLASENSAFGAFGKRQLNQRRLSDGSGGDGSSRGGRTVYLQPAVAFDDDDQTIEMHALDTAAALRGVIAQKSGAVFRRIDPAQRSRQLRPLRAVSTALHPKRRRGSSNSEAMASTAPSSVLAFASSAAAVGSGKSAAAASADAIAASSDFGVFADATRRQQHTQRMSKAQADAVLGIEPRKFRRAAGRKSPDCRFGGGYRAVSPQSRQSLAGSPSSRQLSSAASALSGDSQLQLQPMAVFGSDHVRSAAAALSRRMFNDDYSASDEGPRRANDGGENGNADGDDLATPRSQQSVNSYDESVPVRALSAISAMHEQLMEEGILPSMQPEKVLSDEQLRELGVNKSSFEKIMQSIARTSQTATGAVVSIPAPAAAAAAGGSYISYNDSFDGAELEAGLAADGSRPQTGMTDENNKIPAALLQELTSQPYLTQFDNAADSALSAETDAVTTVGAGTTLINSAEQLHSPAVSPSRTVTDSDKKKYKPLYGTLLEPAQRAQLQQRSGDEAQMAAERHGIASPTTGIAASPLRQQQQSSSGYSRALQPLSLIDSRHPAAALSSKTSLIRQRGNTASDAAINGSGEIALTREPPSAAAFTAAGGVPRVFPYNGSKAPRGMKTKAPPMDVFQSPAPVNPYQSWSEEQHVLNSGVAAGAGLMLWRPRSRVTRGGRYRVGQGFRSSHKQGFVDTQPKQKPFVSAT